MLPAHTRTDAEAALRRSEPCLLVCLCMTALMSASSESELGAQSPLGSEMQINGYTSGDQDEVAVAAGPGGDFVVVWESDGSSAGDDSETSIHARRFAANGTAATADLQVNTYTTNRQFHPSVAVRPDGSFLVVWDSLGSPDSDSASQSVRARLYSSSGPVGSDFEVNTWTTGKQRFPSVAAQPDGFVVVWTSGSLSSGPDGSGYAIRGRVLSDLGTPLGPEFAVNSYTTGTQNGAVVGADGSGRFVVVWTSGNSSLSGPDGDRSSVQAQRFDANGFPIGDELTVNTYTTGLQSQPSVAVASGGEFVVVWQSYGSEHDVDSGSIQARRFDSGGAPTGSQFEVNTFTTDNQRSPSVAYAGNGLFMVVWEGRLSGSTDQNRGIHSRLFHSDGTPITDDLQVNSVIASWQRDPAVAAGTTTDFVVVWESRGAIGTDTGTDYSVRGQRVAGSSIFLDGFESGDTSAW